MRREQGRLREELRLRADPRVLVSLAREAGFDRAALVDPRRLAPWAGKLRDMGAAARLSGRTGTPVSGARGPGDLEEQWVLDPGSWSGSSSLLVCCLSCYRPEPDDLSVPGDPHALIAPFARAHYYRMAIRLLRTFAARLEATQGIPRASLRLFSNSRIPEKPLLAASGLGTYGKNSLTLVPGLGSLFVIAGAVIPIPAGQLLQDVTPLPDPCGSCRRCIDACPTGALVRPGVVDPERCLQGLAASAAVLPADVMCRWGTRLYGCQACQDACPHNSHATAAAPACGEIGPSLPIRQVLHADGAALKGLFQGTAMGMSWVASDALRRNALIAAGNRGDPLLRSAVERFKTSAAPSLRTAAQWALGRLDQLG